MNASAPATRDRILNTGIDLLSKTGLSGVTLGVLAQEVGMSKSGLFAHFRSKDDVQIALLNHTTEIGATHIIQPAMRAAPGLPRLKSLVNHWLGWSTRAGLHGGCPVAAAMFELDDAEGPVRDKVVEMEASWRGFLSQLVEEAIDRGELRRDLDIEQFIWELCGIYLTHHASRRFLRDARSDARARIAFEALLERARPAMKKITRRKRKD